MGHDCSTEEAKQDISHPYYGKESQVAVVVMGIIAIIGTFMNFCKSKSKDRPYIVTYIWLLIDLAVTLYIVSLAVI